MIIEMYFSVPHLDQHPVSNHIKCFEISNSLVGLFKVEIDRAYNFYIDENFSINVFTCPSAY